MRILFKSVCITRLKKMVSCGMVLKASTMLHEKCCNTVLQIGAPHTLLYVMAILYMV